MIGVLGRGADHDRHAPRRLVDDDARDLVALLVVQGQELAVAGERDQPVDALGNLEVDEPAQHGLVDTLAFVAIEGRDDHGVGAAKLLHGPPPRRRRAIAKRQALSNALAPGKGRA